MFTKVNYKTLLFNLILVTSFSISVNTFVGIQNINIIFYLIFHLSFIYFLFYHYHYLFYLLAFVYGVMFDIFLLNSIGAHLISFITLISLYVFVKKYLFLLSPFQISITIFITLIITIFIEMLIAYFFNNINISFSNLFRYFLISAIIFIPSIYILNNLDK